MRATSLLMLHIGFAWDELPDLHGVLEVLRAQGPVVSVRHHGSSTWLIPDHAELNHAFNDDVHFDPSGGYLASTEITMGRNLLAMTGEEHPVTRAMIAPPFLSAETRTSVESLIEPVAHELLYRIEGSGKSSSSTPSP